MPPTSFQLADQQYALSADLWVFAPEVTVCATILVLLVARLFRSAERTHLGGVALGGSAIALLALLGPYLGLWPATPPGPAFTGLLQLDGLALYLRGLLLVFLVLAVVLTRLTGIPDVEDSADFYTLLL